MVGFIVECFIRTTLIAGATAFGLFVTRVGSPRVRHAAWSAVLAAMVVMPFVAGLAPKIDVSSGTLPVARLSTISIDAPVVLRTERTSLPAAASTAPAVAASPADVRKSSEPAASLSMLPYCLGALYLLVAGTLLFRLAAGTLRGREIVRRAAREHGYMVSREAAAPVTMGWFRPVVVLPERSAQWTAAELDAVLAHEREHARRRDPLVQWLAALNRSLFWFHPLAWWLEGKLSALAEEVCDCAVLARGHDPRDYAGYLIGHARAVRGAGARLMPWAPAIGGGALPTRILRLLNGKPSRPATRRQAVSGGAVCALAIFVFAACNAVQKPSPGQSSMSEMFRRDTAKRLESEAKRRALLDEAKRWTPQQVQGKIDYLKANPQDEAAFHQIMHYYELRSDPGGKDALIFWYIEKQPAGKVHPGEINPAWDRSRYEQGKKLWLAHMKTPGARAIIYERAADFLEAGDMPLAEQVLRAGRGAYPNDARWAAALGKLYARALLKARAGTSVNAEVRYAQDVQAKLADSNDATLLAQSAQRVLLMNDPFLRSDNLRSAPVDMALSYTSRALMLDPNNERAKGVKLAAEAMKLREQVRAQSGLTDSARAGLSVTDRIRILTWEAAEAWRKGEVDETASKAGQLLELAKANSKDPQYAEAVFDSNFTLAKVALHRGHKREAAEYLLAAAETPGPADPKVRLPLIVPVGEQLRHFDMNLLRQLVDWGERTAVAEFLERMAPKVSQSRQFLDWAAQIRKGINPDLRPTMSGCGAEPC